MNDAVGQVPNGFQLNEGTGESYRVIENYTAASAYGGITNHYTVLRMQHTKFMQKGYAQHNFSTPATGNDQTCEFWMCNPGPFSLNNKQGFVFFRNETGIVAGISLDAAKIEIYQETGLTYVTSYVYNSWMHIRFEFDISSDQFTVTVNETVLGTYNLGDTTEITNMQIWTEQWYNNPADGTYSFYVDAIGYNWSSAYQTGDNLNLLGGQITGELNGEYTFRNDQIGQEPAQFTVNEGIGENYTVIPSYTATSGHRGYSTHNTVLCLQHTKFMQKGYAQHTFSTPATGNDKTCEFWMCNPGPYSLNNIQVFAFFRNATATVAGISLDAGKIEVIQRSGFTLVGSYVMNSWMHIRFKFDISSEQFTVTVNETVLGTYTLGVTNEITNVQFWTEQWYNNPVDGTYNVYVDAIGYNWSGTYNTGDNLCLVPDTEIIYKSGVPFILRGGINTIVIKDDSLSFRLFELAINAGTITLNVTIATTNLVTTSLPNAQRFFSIDTLAGTFTPNANVKFYYDEGKLTSGQEQLLSLYRFDPSENKWTKVTSIVYPGENYVVAQLSHFSVYGIGYDDAAPPIDWMEITIIITIAGVIAVVITLIVKMRGGKGKGLSPSTGGEIDFDFD